MRGVAFLALLFWAAGGVAQTAAPKTAPAAAPTTAPITYKCADEQRRITYSNTPCEKQGLRDAGPVADRTTSMPFTAPAKPAPPADPAKPPAEKTKK